VRIDKPENAEKFKKTVVGIPPILECHHITGPYDYLLKVLVEDTDALEAFVGELKSLEGVVSTSTAVVLSTLKEKVNRY